MTYTAWLQDPAAVRIVLIEVGVKNNGLEITRYLSTGAYVTSPTDSPANQYYEPVVTTGLQFTEMLDLTGQGSLSGGDIEIVNYNGERDLWLDDIWDNRSIKAWIGDPKWPRADFQMIFNGVVATISSKSREVLNLALRDKLQRLNTPITDVKIGGTKLNKDSVISLSFGEIHNVTPQLTTPAITTSVEYQVHGSAIEGVIEVRDNGKPIGITVDAAAGKFTLNRGGQGTITASVQGDKGGGTYRNTVASLVQRIAQGYGQIDSRFTSDEIDTTNLAAFDIACPQPVGIFADGRTNVLKICQDLASSVGAQVIMSRMGKLRIIQMKVPGNGTAVSVTSTQMVERSLKIQARPLVKASCVLGFDKNWTVQADLLTGIPQEHKTLFAEEWLTATVTSTSVQADYKLNAAPLQEDTMLCKRTDATTEAQRRLDLWSVPRTHFTFEGTSDLLETLELGNAVTITSARFGLKDGKTGICISLAPNWLTGRVTVGVLI